MKKQVIITSMIVMLLAGCGNAAKNNHSEEGKSEEATIKITVPTQYVTKDNKVEEWEQSLISNEKVAGDNVVYSMTNTNYRKLLKESKENLQKTLHQVEKSPEFKGVNKIEQMNDYQNLRISVNKKDYAKLDRDKLFKTIGLPIIHYQLLHKLAEDSIVIECEVIVAESGEVVEVVNLPMDLSNGVLK